MTEAHADRKHATLAPSAAHRWIPCPGSIRMSAGIVEAPSSYAAEGTAAHQLAEHCVSTGFDAERLKGYVIDTQAKGPWYARFRKDIKPDGKTRFAVDAEMIDGVQLYLDVVNELAETYDEFEVEERMDISSLVPGVFGTGDAIAWRESPTRRVAVADLKYGKGVAVEVEENEQLLTYAVGVVQRYHNRGVDEAELIIVQPRAPHRDGPVRRWVVDIVGLYEHIMTLQRAAEAAAQPDAPLVPGDWCRFCKAAAACPALRDRVDVIVGAQRVGGEIVKMSDPEKVPYRDWKIEAAEMSMVAGWLKRREEHARAEALRGNMPPGAKLVAKRAIRKWQDEDIALAALRMADLSDDDIFETTMRSPAQMEKALPKKERELIDRLAKKTSSGTVLAPIDDPRPAAEPNDASGFEPAEVER